MLLLRLQGMWCITIFRHAFGGLPCLLDTSYIACVPQDVIIIVFVLFLLCTEANKVEIVRQGAVGPLLGVARSHDPRVQRNATGALLNLTHIGKPPPLSLSLPPSPSPPSPLLHCLLGSHIARQSLFCARSGFTILSVPQTSFVHAQHIYILPTLHDVSLTVYHLCNSSKLILICTPPPHHLDSNRHELVQTGAVPVFVQLLDSSDEDVQFYCAAALSNLAVHGKSGRTNWRSTLSISLSLSPSLSLSVCV